ncbi:hypothetical protein IOD14_00070 [Streptomyces sp. A2-16]|uniref:hypothetical protein n=1 Tax=Streptomyces sp. A2-16 TaxID=2781734 RepID=UPI001BAF34C8|nr:hypothetical protein [Streptomyces sp. A2-16]QUC63779.1 hypothetical protein IOD14_00070 [Streptomyces sp. A2-16]
MDRGGGSWKSPVFDAWEGGLVGVGQGVPLPGAGEDASVPVVGEGDALTSPGQEGGGLTSPGHDGGLAA